MPLDLFALGQDLLTFLGIRAEEALSFFVYDVLKIFALLAVIVFVVSVIRTFIPPSTTRRLLAGRTWSGHILASLFGMVTPFCTCSAIPLFLGFIQTGVPVAVTFSFLVASPLINEIAVGLLLALFGWRVTLLYIGSGLAIAVLSGLALRLFRPERFLLTIGENGMFEETFDRTWSGWGQRTAYAWSRVKAIVRKVWLYILIGIAIGAIIHGYVPEDFLARYAGPGNPFAVPFAVLLGIPLYSNAAGVLPLVSALTEKGVSMGTTLAFMMSVTALSLPEFFILRRIMKTQLVLLFFGIVGAGILLTGFLFNAVLG
ncbi:MAG: permease [Candidatus Peribacteraceae bacterium]|nr:permease [Candidatus Peribacteraceae bacterium]